MIRNFMIAAASAAVLTLSAPVFAQQDHGTADEAKAMLDKAVAAVKADEAVALAMFIKGEGGFKDRDLYVFCFRASDGKALASPPSVPAGTDARTLKDFYRQSLWLGALRRRAEAGRSIYPGQLHVPAAGRRQDAGCKNKFRHEGSRSGLRRRLLQVDRSAWRALPSLPTK